MFFSALALFLRRQRECVLLLYLDTVIIRTSSRASKHVRQKKKTGTGSAYYATTHLSKFFSFLKKNGIFACASRAMAHTQNPFHILCSRCTHPAHTVTLHTVHTQPHAHRQTVTQTVTDTHTDKHNSTQHTQRTRHTQTQQ